MPGHVSVRPGRFGALIAAQAAHSVEEYLGRLYDVFPPARLISGLVASDRERGFIALNLALVCFGVWCWLVPVRRRASYAAALAWGWVVVESINGVGHPLWSLLQGRYTPGVATAPLLFVLALLVGRDLAARR